MKILIHSNAPWAGTGYGQQTHNLARLLQEDGHEVAVSAFWGLYGAVLSWEGIKVYPNGAHPYGNDVVLSHAENHFGGDLLDGLIITLIDAWVLDAQALSRANVAHWVPIDHDPAPPDVLRALETSGGFPIAMSRFGEDRLRAAGLEPFYCPHGIDTERFAPVLRKQAREQIGMEPDAFIVGMVAANKGYPCRKGFDQAMAAFAKFAKRRKDAILYLHSEPMPVLNGHDLPAMANAYGIPENRIRYVNRYHNLCGLSAEVVASIYNACDVLLNPAYGEGFGIPIVEAQACGTPVIATDWTAMPELVGAGWLVDGDPMFTPQRSFWKVPRVASILRALNSAYEEAEGLRERAREFALGYDWRKVHAECWRPTLAAIEGAVRAPEPPDEVELKAAA